MDKICSHQHCIEGFPLKSTEGNTSLHGVSIPGSPLHRLPGNHHSLPPGGAFAYETLILSYADHTPSTSKQRRTPRLGSDSEKANMQGGIAS